MCCKAEKKIKLISINRLSYKLNNSILLKYDSQYSINQWISSKLWFEAKPQKTNPFFYDMDSKIWIYIEKYGYEILVEVLWLWSCIKDDIYVVSTRVLKSSLFLKVSSNEGLRSKIIFFPRNVSNQLTLNYKIIR